MKVFVTGSIAFDYIMVFPGKFRDHILPEKMHILSVSFLVESLRRMRGGTAPNIAYNLALLGQKPTVVGTVGEDFTEYRAWLESRGVDTSGIKEIPSLFTASCFINTDLQDNQITAFYPLPCHTHPHYLSKPCMRHQPILWWLRRTIHKPWRGMRKSVLSLVFLTFTTHPCKHPG